MDYNYLYFLREALVCYLDEFKQDNTEEEFDEEKTQVNSWICQMMEPKLRANDRFYLSELLKCKVLKGVTKRVNSVQVNNDKRVEKTTPPKNSPESSPEISRLKVESGTISDDETEKSPKMSIYELESGEGDIGITGPWWSSE